MEGVEGMRPSGVTVTVHQAATCPAISYGPSLSHGDAGENLK